MKVCTSCKKEKQPEFFAKNGKSGLHSCCKACACEKAKKHRLENLEAAREADRKKYELNTDVKKASISAYYAKNKEAIKARNRDRYRAKQDHIKAMSSAYRAANKHKVYEWNGTRRAALRSALPVWADRQEIRRFYVEAKRLTLETGIKHHVDHVLPLGGKLVCGLHVSQNLRVVTAAENLAKSNSYQ